MAEMFPKNRSIAFTKGQWLDPRDSRLYRDESRRVSVVCDNKLLEQARQAVIKIGKELGQKAMYFEVRDYDGVHLIEIPTDQPGSDPSATP